MGHAERVTAIGCVWTRRLARVALYTFAFIGLLWAGGGPLLRLLFSPLFVTETLRSLPSPDSARVAEIEVRRGGFGTVWTMRVKVRRRDTESWTIYETGDSDFVPPVQWADSDTLLVGLPCGRFDHASNPDDWQRLNASERPLKVRFTYRERCARSF
jgi:hypothetical protein